jgi:hypothetical protein
VRHDKRKNIARFRGSPPFPNPGKDGAPSCVITWKKNNEWAIYRHPAALAEWLFLREKATFIAARNGYIYCGTAPEVLFRNL